MTIEEALKLARNDIEAWDNSGLSPDEAGVPTYLPVLVKAIDKYERLFALDKRTYELTGIQDSILNLAEAAARAGKKNRVDVLNEGIKELMRELDKRNAYAAENTCERCEGDGEIKHVSRSDWSLSIEDCPDCDGTGVKKCTNQ